MRRNQISGSLKLDYVCAYVWISRTCVVQCEYSERCTSAFWNIISIIRDNIYEL